MYGKGTTSFLILFLLLDPVPSSAFLEDKCSIDFKQLPNGNKADKRDVMYGAHILAEFFNEKSEFRQTFPSTNKFVNDLVQYGTDIITPANLAYFGTVVYLGAVILTSYCYLVHSRMLLAEIEFLEKKLNLVIEHEVRPVLQAIEDVLNNGAEHSKEEMCNARVDVTRMLKERKDKIQHILEDVRRYRKQAIEGEEKVCGVVVGAVVVGVVGWIGCALAAPLETFFVFLGVSFVVGMFGLAGTLGYTSFEASKENYQKSLKLIDRLEDKALAAEKAITMLSMKVETRCILE